MRLDASKGRRVVFGVMAVLMAGSGGCLDDGTASTDDAFAAPVPDYAPDEVIVGLVPGADTGEVKKALDRIGGKKKRDLRGVDAQLWKVENGTTVERAIEILQGDEHKGIVEYAEPNYVVRSEAFNNDLHRARQWALHNVGQDNGTVDADIDAPWAWNMTTGSASVVVGVIDSGINYTHPDLAANIWTNPGEIAENGIDDDGNGYVDDVRGWDFANDDNDPMDDYYHGSHCAGTIGAVGNNGIGVAGICWNVRLMPIKFIGSSGTGLTSDAIDAIGYAASFKNAANKPIVRITQNSWISSTYSKSVETAIKNSGALFVAAAGNNGGSTPWYPAALSLDNIITVAATDRNDALASFSNFSSTWVDLGAPGVTITSTGHVNNYPAFSGTSMAAPFVSGAAALVLSLSPNLTVAKLKSQLMKAVDLKPSLGGKCVTGGRLNLAKALGAAESSPSSDPLPPSAVTDLTVTGSTDNSLTLTWTATGDDGVTGTAYLYEMRSTSLGPITEETWTSAVVVVGEPNPGVPGTLESFTRIGMASSTTFYMAIRVIDEMGNISPISNVAAGTTAAPTSP